MKTLEKSGYWTDEAIAERQRKYKERRAAMTQEERDAEDEKNKQTELEWRFDKRFRNYNDSWRLKYEQDKNQGGHDIIMQIDYRRSLEDVSKEDRDALLNLADDEKLDRWIKVKNASYAFASYNMDGQCRKCDQVVLLETNGLEVRASGKGCKYRYGGYPPHEFDLEIPSGKMVVGNDFRDLFPIAIDSDEYHWDSSNPGMGRLLKAYAKVGMAHAFVGNTCPGIYKMGPDIYIIGGGYQSDPDDYDDESYVEIGEQVASVCTDLWWYSICDYDEYVKRSGVDPDKIHNDVIEVTPGTYHFIHQTHCIDRDASALIPFAWFKLKKRKGIDIPQPKEK